MSADNWTFCPRCADNDRNRIAKLKAALNNAYGKVTVEKFDEMRTEANKPSPLKESFREDYEFYGAEEGTITASYRGSCNTCNLAVEFEHDVPFYPEVTS